MQKNRATVGNPAALFPPGNSEADSTDPHFPHQPVSGAVPVPGKTAPVF